MQVEEEEAAVAVPGEEVREVVMEIEEEEKLEERKAQERVLKRFSK
jgi:hypothetical protein